MDKLVYKEITLDRDLKICYIEDIPINLTKAEYLLLEFLIENKNKVFSRKELLQLWNKEASLRTIDTTISRLRKKLGKYEHYLITRVGFGYGIN